MTQKGSVAISDPGSGEPWGWWGIGGTGAYRPVQPAQAVFYSTLRLRPGTAETLAIQYCQHARLEVPRVCLPALQMRSTEARSMSVRHMASVDMPAMYVEKQ